MLIPVGAALATAPPPPCAALMRSARDFVVGWDQKQLAPLLQTVLLGDAKRAVLCARLGVSGRDGDGAEGSAVRALIGELGAVGECLGICASGNSCSRELAQLDGATALACSGLSLLDCNGGLPAALQERCDALRPAAPPADLPALGATLSLIHI